MKIKSIFKCLFTSTIVAFFLLICSLESKAQDQNIADVKEFKITIEQTDKGLKMQSSKGSAWIELSFSLRKNKAQAIDEYGMTKLAKVSTIKDPKIADYLFTITKKKGKILLTGIEGTVWKELSFSLPKKTKQSIDHLGMTEEQK
ncbi:MAG: hypothetical protein WAS56_02465 [Saprospiraceae bacterium]|nr:hypothetical protein [Flavobacterium sp.]